jgi:stage II sporulation protein D
MSGPLATSVGEPTMRVRIAAGVETISLACVGGLLGAPADPNPLVAIPLSAGSAGDTRAHVPLATSASLRLDGPSWVFANAQGEVARLAAGSPLVVWSENASSIGVNGTLYPGRLRIIPRSDLSEREFDVVEFVPLESYLPGVVAKELPQGWPAESYRVQAVCARTYALQERQRSIAAGERSDVEASDRDQVYLGASAGAHATDAVRATTGHVLTWNGDVLRGYYSSTCGGRTASARDTWPTGPGFEFNLAAPIQAKPREHACQGSPLYRWSVSRDRTELILRFRAYGERAGHPVKRLKDIASVEPAGLNEDLRPSRFRVTDSLGSSVTMSAEEFRLACNADVPPAPGSFAIASVDRRSRVNSGDVDVAIAGQVVTISGRGFGHGVGMCQYCARGFAERGETWQAMLARFYPGAALTKMY